jgi:CO/xanthine dehydrogenase Mo-binding subunit
MLHGIGLAAQVGAIACDHFTLVSDDDNRALYAFLMAQPPVRATALPNQLPFLGAGEAGQGPSAAALGNAIADATGQRLRDLPLSREHIRAALRA